MADNTKIEWARHPVTGKGASWNPVLARRPDGKLGYHCEHTSPGCVNCYSEGFNARNLPNRGTGLPFKPGHRKDVEIVLDEATLLQPLRWTAPRGIFVCSMTDLFGEFVPDALIDRVFAVMALCPQHVFFVLTKRPDRMREYIAGHKSAVPYLGRMPLERLHIEAAGHMSGDGGYMEALKRAGNVYSLYLDAPWPLLNVWLGTSVEDQERAEERVPELLATPAAVRWISAEPLLGPVRLHVRLGDDWLASGKSGERRGLDWVVAGGESGPYARPMHPDWARSLRDQCAAAGVPFHFKQWGEYLPVGQNLPGSGKIHGGTAVTPGRMKLHYGGTSQQAPKHAFAERGVAFTSTADGRRLTFRVGKKAAGRILDGRTHDAMPGAPA